MPIYVRENSPARIMLAGICYEGTPEGRMWVDGDDPQSSPMECYCVEMVGGPDYCIGPVYRLENPGILIYETEAWETDAPPETLPQNRTKSDEAGRECPCRSRRDDDRNSFAHCVKLDALPNRGERTMAISTDTNPTWQEYPHRCGNETQGASRPEWGSFDELSMHYEAERTAVERGFVQSMVRFLEVEMASAMDVLFETFHAGEEYDQELMKVAVLRNALTQIPQMLADSTKAKPGCKANEQRSFAVAGVEKLIRESVLPFLEAPEVSHEQ